MISATPATKLAISIVGDILLLPRFPGVSEDPLTLLVIGQANPRFHGSADNVAHLEHLVLRLAEDHLMDQVADRHAHPPTRYLGHSFHTP